jgi:hypothetical protein
MKKTRVIIIDATQKKKIPENPKGQRGGGGYSLCKNGVTTDWQTPIGKDQVTSKEVIGVTRFSKTLWVMIA